MMKPEPYVGLKWIDARDKTPTPEDLVLVIVNIHGHKHIIEAAYEDGTVDTSSSKWYWGNQLSYLYDPDFCETIIPKGWWAIREMNDFDEHVLIEDPVLYWAPIMF